MAQILDEQRLSEEFLLDLIHTCLQNDYILGVVCNNMESDNFPDKDSMTIFRALRKYYYKHGKCPPYSILRETVTNSKGAVSMLQEAHTNCADIPVDDCVEMLEAYLRRVKFLKCYRDAGAAYNKEGSDVAVQKLGEYVAWQQSFSLTSSDYTDVVGTFLDRFKLNRQKNNEQADKRQVTRFYIDELDQRNGGRDLRSQLTYFLAPTGVGKSHAARWIGRNACMDGLNVLHFQLEGSKKEVEDAYSASLVFCNSYKYEHGLLRDSEVDRMQEELSSVTGRLFVKTYPRFNTTVSTVNIKEGIAEFVKIYSIRPDVVIIDSADLLTDAGWKRRVKDEERHKRVSVANDLKDLAADENVWIVATYQSTIEDPAWLNDEKNVLTEYNTSEAKGVSRPLTHLITFNQSVNEYREQTMRINVAKSRFFKKGDVFKIATDYDNEKFYDRERTMNINKANE